MNFKKYCSVVPGKNQAAVRPNMEVFTLTTQSNFVAKMAAEARRLFEGVVVPVMTEEHRDEDGRAGAVLEVRDGSNCVWEFTRAGNASEDEFCGYEENAMAKNAALEKYPEILTSWEVHRGDLSEPPYPGAIRTPYDDRIAISGFTWERDTYGSLWLAVKMDRMSYREAVEIANICGIRDRFREVICKLNARHRQLLAA